MRSSGLSFVTLLLLALLLEASQAFSMASSRGEIYGIPNSGWTSPEWNWGYAQGTGHDCAAICRELYLTRDARQKLVDNLLAANADAPSNNPEEIKLILALEWQRGRWDGTDGGRGGYGEVLSAMAAAQRYEKGPSYDECLRRLVADMADRFGLLGATAAEVKEMQACITCDSAEEGFRKSAGMVLRAMGYIDRGM